MMLPVLSLAFLGMAAALDGEESGEQSWARWFEECDRLRAQYHLPPLTRRERMKKMLGEPNRTEEYFVEIGSWRKTKKGILLFDLEIYKEQQPEPFYRRRSWLRIGVKHLKSGKFEGKVIRLNKQWIQAGRTFAEKLYLPFKLT